MTAPGRRRARRDPRSRAQEGAPRVRWSLLPSRRVGRMTRGSFGRQGRFRPANSCGRTPLLSRACSFRAGRRPQKEKGRGNRRPFRRDVGTLTHLLRVLANVRGLQPLGTLRDVELDLLPLAQRAEASAMNRRVMDEHIRSVSRAMNPYPFASLNHFTLPVAIYCPPTNVDSVASFRGFSRGNWAREYEGSKMCQVLAAVTSRPCRRKSALQNAPTAPAGSAPPSRRGCRQRPRAPAGEQLRARPPASTPPMATTGMPSRPPRRAAPSRAAGRRRASTACRRSARARRSASRSPAAARSAATSAGACVDTAIASAGRDARDVGGVQRRRRPGARRPRRRPARRRRDR